MYLRKQWHESRIAIGIGLLGLVLVVALCVVIYKTSDTKEGLEGSLDVFLVIVYYVQALLVSAWAWFLGSIGIGKALGEGSGAFLFTRPRNRGWFLWRDWSFGMGLQATVVLMANLIVGVLCYRLVSVRHFASPGFRFVSPDGPPSLVFLFSLIAAGVLLLSGLTYSLTLLCTVVLKRASSGVMLSAGLCIAYFCLLTFLETRHPAIHFPSPIQTVFSFRHKVIYGLAGNLPMSMAIRTFVMLLFPMTALAILKRADL